MTAIRDTAVLVGTAYVPTWFDKEAIKGLRECLGPAIIVLGVRANYSKEGR